jgi:putative ABC transport system permease protein
MKQLEKISASIRQKLLTSRWLIGQIAFTYLILFGAFTWLLDWMQIYRQPLSQQIDQVYTLTLNAPEPSADSAPVESVKQYLKTHPRVEAVSISSFNTPYSTNTIRYFITHQTEKVFTNVQFVGQNYARILAIDTPAGRWFTQADAKASLPSAVINTTLAKRLFTTQSALGQRIQLSQPPFSAQVVGVVNYRGTNDEFERPHNELFLLASTPQLASERRLVLRSKTPLTARQEADLIAQVKKATGSAIRFDKVADQKATQEHVFLLWTGIKAAVAGFCSLFCLIGLMGTLLTELYRRREEVGLRRVLGARMPRIWIQLLIEYWCVSVFVISFASILTLQFPLLDLFGIPSSLYLSAMLIALLSILGLLTCFIVGFYYPLQRFTPAYSMKPFRLE